MAASSLVPHVAPLRIIGVWTDQEVRGGQKAREACIA
jgi:hypothetical protein